MFTEIFYVPEVTGKLVNLSSDFLKKNKINICWKWINLNFMGNLFLLILVYKNR